MSVETDGGGVCKRRSMSQNADEYREGERKGGGEAAETDGKMRGAYVRREPETEGVVRNGRNTKEHVAARDKTWRNEIFISDKIGQS